MRLLPFLSGALVIGLAAGPLEAQQRAGTLSRARTDEERAVIGITTGNGGRRDTLGVLVTSVTRGGPAEKAGLAEGDRIAAINNVNLRLSADDIDAGDMEGVPGRRLVRELAKLDPGADVDLRVWSEGRSKSVRIKTVSARDLEEERMGVREDDVRNRAVIGFSVGSTGSRRDTLGLMVMRITTDGPADKAGLQEGDRIAAINGVDLRTPREDVDEPGFNASRSARLTRELRKVKVGDDVELRVYSSGQTRTVRVRPVKASELPRESGGAFFFRDGFPGAITIPRVRITTPRSFEFDTDFDRDEGFNFNVTPRGRVEMLAPRQRIEVESRVRDAMERARETLERTRENQREAFDRARDRQRDALERVRESQLRLQQELRTRLQPTIERIRLRTTV
jgi:hypothetical protein